MRRQCAQIMIVCIETVGWLTFNSFYLGVDHARANCPNHTGRYLILQVKDILK